MSKQRRLTLYADQRDMTRKQFNAALKKHGFAQTLLWFRDLRGDGSTSHGGMIHPRTKKLWRRATLAKLLHLREKEAA